jgi:hypothetical protein
MLAIFNTELAYNIKKRMIMVGIFLIKANLHQYGVQSDESLALVIIRL